jgi:hypothetical protein
MSIPYFRYLPNFEYVNRLKENKNISKYIQVKNLFKRGKLREDIIENISYFTKYKVVGDQRPDNIAFEIYGSQYLDWAVLLCNNIINFENEWPLSQESFKNYLYSKYLNDTNLNKVHHYETLGIKDSLGKIIVPSGLKVPSSYSITYIDSGNGRQYTKSEIKTVTNYDYEIDIDNNKRNIYLLKPDYISIITNDIEGELLYKRGSSQYISPSLVRGENIKLYS